MKEEAKKELFEKNRHDRAKELKALKIKQRETMSSKNLLPKKFQGGVHLGLKKTLKGLEQDNVQAVIYDCGVNVDALTLLFDKGHIPMIPLPNLSDCVKDQIGFPALCLSFPKIIQDEEVLEHFKPVLDILHNIPGIVVKNKKSVVLPDLVPKKQDSSILRGHFVSHRPERTRGGHILEFHPE